MEVYMTRILSKHNWRGMSSSGV